MVDAALFPNGLGKKKVLWTVLFSKVEIVPKLVGGRERDRDRERYTHTLIKKCNIC